MNGGRLKAECMVATVVTKNSSDTIRILISCEHASNGFGAAAATVCFFLVRCPICQPQTNSIHMLAFPRRLL